MKRFKEIYQWCCEPRQLFFLFIIVLAIPNVALFFTEQMPLLVRICNIILPVSVYWMVMTLSRKPGKIIWILFPFVFFAAFQLVLLYLFGQSIIAVDMFLNLLTTNSGEAMELLDNLLPAVIGVFVVYLPTLALGIVSITGNKKLDQYFIYRQRRYARMTIGVGVILTALCYADHEDYALKLDMYPVNVCYNLTLAIERAGETAGYQESSKEFTFGAQATHDKDEAEIYVLVVGETARACNFGLYGYERNTTPLLDKTEGLVAFTDVLTQSNTTHKSVPMLLSGASAENYNRIYREKGIITAFKEAGFHTAFFSNQRPNHSFIDFLGEQADEHYFLKEGASAKDNHYDSDLLQKLDGILPAADASSSKQYRYRKLFVVLHTYGSHFNYQERYPRNFAFFKPDCKSEAKPENRRDLLNAYDNTIRYTDYILHGIVERLQKWEKTQAKTDGVYSQPTSAMLYTSDHGENIFDDDRRLFLHAAPKASDYELHVPFIIWTSSGYGKQYPGILKTLSGHRTQQVQTSLSAFHTMLGIGGILTRYRQDKYSVASEKYHPVKLFYLDDHDKAIPQENAKY